MDSRRTPRTVIDPKVRQVGFFTPSERTTPARPERPDPFQDSQPSNSLSPVIIPPPRPVPPPPFSSPFRPDSAPAASSSTSFNPADCLPPPAASPTASAVSSSIASRTAADEMSPGRVFRSGGGPARAASSSSSSFPGGGVDTTALRASSVPASELTTVSVVNMPPSFSEKVGGGYVEMQSDRSAHSKQPKEKTTKAERCALQDAQRAAKAAAKAEGSKSLVTSGNIKPAKSAMASLQKNDGASVSASDKKVLDRLPEKDRRKDVPQPRMQYDDKSRVEKLKRRAVVYQTEARNRVELFRHLPQYEHGTQLPDLESKFFQLDTVHPSVYKVGLQYLSGDISGGNARCIGMLLAFRDAINDYSTPPEKTLNRDLTSKIGSYVSFLIECRPLSISMGNAIRFLKSRIAKLPLTMSESEAKASLHSDIDRFINEKIILADKVIVKYAVTKIRDGDVLLTYGSSSAVELILIHAQELGKQFRVIVVDSRPKLEGQLLLRRLVSKGINCTYANINAVSYIMHEVTRVFLGASSIFSNGTLYSRVGTACVAMVAHAYNVPVLVCCEAYKFHERVQLDSICSNELGDPEAIKKIPGREEVSCLDNTASNDKLQVLNLIYDLTPSDYISMIITDHGMVPPTSVPVIVREHRGEYLWM